MSDQSGPGRIGLVPPRYGSDVVGGAEAVIAEVAHGLADRGWDVEILTTCARDHFTWANEYPAGTSLDGAVTVRRFETVMPKDRSDRDRLGGRILRGERMTISDQQLWMNSELRVPGLWDFVFDNSSDYRAIMLAPYLFWTSFAVGQIAPERTVLMPCLHDEPMAHLELFAPLFSDARGVLFLSDPEAELADKLFRLPERRATVGAPVSEPAAVAPEAFLSSHGIERPAVYYAGRREWGKGWSELVDAFHDAVVLHGLPLDLMTSGVGPVDVPDAIADRVIDLGFLEPAERDAAMAAAAVYVQPSALESFSRTVMEAWLAGTPVVANADSDVVSWHVERSGAGLLYRTHHELVECLRLAADHPSTLSALAEPGAGYVRSNYTPDTIFDRVDGYLREWT